LTNILQVCPVAYGISEGGIAECVNNVSRILAQRHNVTVFSSKPNQAFPRVQDINGVRVERFKYYAPSGSYFFSFELPLRLKRGQFEIVHGHGYHSFPLHYCTLAKCKKFIASTHFHGHGHTSFRDSLFRLFKPFGRETLRKADKIVAVSAFEKSLLEKTFNIDPSKVVIIPNGLNLSEFSGLKSPKRDFRSVLYVGTLQTYKGPQYLLEVLPKLDQDIILEIVGKGPLKKTLELRAKALNVSNRVKFYQDLTRDELLERYAQADVFVLLSQYEAYSIVVAEALAAGKPCVLAQTSALVEWVDDESCFGADYPININKLAEVINVAMNSGINQSKTKKWIGTKILDWKEVARRLESIYT